MACSWHELTGLTRGERFVVERVKLTNSEIAVEGRFDPPALAMLSADDQVFVMAFVRSHGSIKEMERTFGVSYPTVKNRLSRISDQLPLVEMGLTEPGGSADVLGQLRDGEISPAEAIRRLSR